MFSIVAAEQGHCRSKTAAESGRRATYGSGISPPHDWEVGEIGMALNIKTMKAVCFASVLAALTTVVVDTGGSKAAIFTVGGQDYDITTFAGTYNANTSKFATPANGGVMPWWGNSSLAQQFVTVVQFGLGSPNVSGTRGPLFASTTLVDTFGTFMQAYMWDGSSAVSSNPGITASRTYAQATLVTPPAGTSVPGPLPLLGAVTAFGMSRRLRRRIAT